MVAKWYETLHSNWISAGTQSADLQVHTLHKEKRCACKTTSHGGGEIKVYWPYLKYYAKIKRSYQLRLLWLLDSVCVCVCVCVCVWEKERRRKKVMCYSYSERYLNWSFLCLPTPMFLIASNNARFSGIERLHIGNLTQTKRCWQIY